MATSTDRTTTRLMTIMATATTAARRTKDRWVVTLPLIVLAIPSVIIGAMTVQPLMFGGGFGESIYFNAEHHEVLHEIGEAFGNWLRFRRACVRTRCFTW